MSSVDVQPGLLYAWHGPSLLIVNARGDCSQRSAAGDGAGNSGSRMHEATHLTGFYFREARYLSTLRLELNGTPPWLCESAMDSPTALAFNYVHPELMQHGGGGTGESQGEITTDEFGIPHRAVDVSLRYEIGVASLNVNLELTNRSTRPVSLDVRLVLDADFADILEAQGERRQDAPVACRTDGANLTFVYEHPELRYRTLVACHGAAGREAGLDAWQAGEHALTASLRLAPGESRRLGAEIRPADFEPMPSEHGVAERESDWREWLQSLARVETPGNQIAGEIVRRNVSDIASFALLEGERDEWLTLQAGIPAYPALFGRDTLTAGWQSAFLDRGASLDASLARLGRMQSDRVLDWRDEEPGRIPYQVRSGPLARLNINPYSAYYADFASPLMFVVSLAHLYSWTGEKRCLERHWDTARRIMEWARDRGDRDGDGYLEYLTRSPEGAKNQGWKDSGLAIPYEDGSAVPSPTATCELQGYWFAAQQLMAVLSWVMGERDSAREYWRGSADLKARFNRDWWVEEDSFFALAMDPDKRLVSAPSSNVGHCLASGIIDDDHLPRTVGRMFAPDMFSGWGIRTLTRQHPAYNPVSYHLGSVWAVEQSTIAFGLRRFGFDTRALEIAHALFDLAQLYAGYRIPECVGGYARTERSTPGAYPRANPVQLWNASSFALLVHTMLGLQPVGPLSLLVVDPALPTWLPEVIVHDLKLGGATATLRFWRDEKGASHAETLRKKGTLHLIRQPPLESLRAGLRDRFGALADSVLHH